jgi:hypothetical protein
MIDQFGQQVTTVSNMLSEDRSYVSVSYAITGDAEVDAIAGCLAVFKSHGLDPFGSKRVIDYLLDRMKPSRPTIGGLMQEYLAPSQGKFSGASIKQISPPDRGGPSS